MPKPKPTPAYVPPSRSDHALTPSVSSASVYSHAADLRRDSSASPFTPPPSISGPIPPLPPQRYQNQPSRETSFRDREYREAPRRPSLRDSPGSTPPQHNPYVSTSQPGSYSNLPSGHSTPPIPSNSLPRTSSNASHMSIKSTSSAGSMHRGSLASIRTNDPLPPLPHQSPSSRSSLYSVDDVASSKSSKSEFHLERPTDDAVIEQMFNDLIVSSL